MKRPAVKWRLEGGYSRFLEGSHAEIKFEQPDFSELVDLSPVGLIRRTEPVEFLFEFSKGYRAMAGPGLSWSVTPETHCRALFLFAGQPFLGNFRVPAGHFAVQYDIEAQADGRAKSDQTPFLFSLNAGTRLYQSWVTVFPVTGSVGLALKNAWLAYRDPLQAGDLLLLSEGQVIRWRLTGEVAMSTEFSWGIGGGWTIPDRIPLAELKTQLVALAGAGASFELKQSGEFSLQVRKSRGRISVNLRREKEKSADITVSLGAQLDSPLEVTRLGPTKPKAVQVLATTLSQPVTRQISRVLEEGLSRRVQLALTIENRHWQSATSVFKGTWLRPDYSFVASYCRLLAGQVPASSKDCRFSGQIDSVRGRKFAIRLHLLDWLKLGTQSTSEVRRVATLGPLGEVAVEETRTVERVSYRWDEIQLLTLMWKHLSGADGVDENVRWTWGLEGEFSREELRARLAVLLHAGVINEMVLPSPASFPIKMRLVAGTEFSPGAIERVRCAEPPQRWAGLVRALEISEPDQYRPGAYLRDWIDSAEVRNLIERDPISADLLTRYPIGGRTQPERTLAVSAYKRARRFLTLMEAWRAGASRETALQSAELGIDVPVFLYFHLLSDPGDRKSAAVMTGDLEGSWGDLSLLAAD